MTAVHTGVVQPAYGVLTAVHVVSQPVYGVSASPVHAGGVHPAYGASASVQVAGVQPANGVLASSVHAGGVHPAYGVSTAVQVTAYVQPVAVSQVDGSPAVNAQST